MSEKIKNTPSRGPLALVSVFCLSLCACESIVDEREQYSLSEETTHSYLDSRLDFLRARVEEYPKRDDYHYQIASVHFEKGDFNLAVSSLEEAIDLRPDIPRYRYHLGRVCLKMGEIDSAEINFRKAAELTDAQRYSGVNAALGYVLALKKDLPGAEAAFRKALVAEPDNPESYYFLGAIYDLQGKKDDAVKHFREYLARGGRQYRSNALFYLEKLGVEVDTETSAQEKE